MRRAAALSVAALGLSLVIGAAPAHAEPVELTLSGTRVTPGQVSFRLTAHGLADGLDASRLRVLVGDRALAAELDGRRLRASVPAELAGVDATVRVVLAVPGGGDFAVATERVSFAGAPASPATGPSGPSGPASDASQPAVGPNGPVADATAPATGPNDLAVDASDPAADATGPAPDRSVPGPGPVGASRMPAAVTTTSAPAASVPERAVSPAPVPSAALDLETAGSGGGSGRGLLAAAGVALAASAAIGLWLLFSGGGGRNEFQRRLDTLRQFTDARGTAPDEQRFTAQTRLVLGILHWLDGRLSPKLRASIELSVQRAGVSLDPAEWLLVRIAITVVAAVAMGALFGSWFGLLFGALAGWVCPGQWLSFRAGRRSRAFTDQLPDALRLMVGALRSGFTLNQSIDAVVREGQAPVSTELGRAMAETRLGDDLENALDRVGERNNNPDVGWIVMAIRIQREVGGNLSEVLETAVHTMRERAKLNRHVRALSAEGRLSGIILFAMPFVIAAVLLVLRPEYVRPLYTEPAGLAMVAVAAVLLTVGAVWLRRLVEVKV
ncbi:MULTISPECIES: type II secretion system F family protein [Catenuloplanes]|uniref:Tight adherence protein B n=1 Tax=Catenuloplanes niger TaxID=587534 RepID=A0AAE4CTY2_9ACTN|nr:type II secretion system F family protein [Catenuloplanes niger]MDR7324580.1 tight adherence protein B [Catenuloplanes niger]